MARVPKLWEGTIQAHRDAVREAVIETTWQLVQAHGVLSVTMSQIASEVGIGRATLYKYFPDVEAILLAGHQQHVTEHVEHLEEAGSQPGAPLERLRAVLLEFARICHERGHHGTEELVALMHKPAATRHAEEQVHALIQGLIVTAAEAGGVRRDIAPTDLAHYCVHALGAAAKLHDNAGIDRLVDLCLTGMASSGRRK